MTGKLVNTYLYTRYERFWHWLQMVLIVTLLVTGFDKLFRQYVTSIPTNRGLCWNSP